MREQRLADGVVDGQRQSFQTCACIKKAAHRGLRLRAADRCKQSLSADPGLLVHWAGDHPWVFYDPLSILTSRRLEKPDACVSGLRDKFKKHCWKRQGFWIFLIYNKNMLRHKKAPLGPWCVCSGSWGRLDLNLDFSKFLFIQGGST